MKVDNIMARKTKYTQHEPIQNLLEEKKSLYGLRTYVSLFSSAGNGGNVISRINCNEFVENLRTNHNFRYGKVQDVNSIRATIPDEYLSDFDSGLNM